MGFVVNKYLLIRTMKSFQLIIALLLCHSLLFGQDEETEPKLSVNGYLGFNQMVLLDDVWLTDNQFLNRLELEYTFSEKISAVVQGRNRLNYGDSYTLNPQSATQFEYDAGFFDLTANIADGKSYVLNTQCDRAYLKYSGDKFDAVIGRQRINWARSLVWNPNDIYSSYSFFDLSYPERAGTDAVLFTYYSGPMSQLDIVASVNADDSLTLSGRYKFNVKNVDLQVIASYFNQSDLIAGAGFEGYVKDYSLRGEFSVISPIENSGNEPAAFVSSLAIDRMFSNQLSLQAEWLYNSFATPEELQSFEQFYATPFSVKSLSFDNHSFFLRANYPLTPLINGGISGMYYLKLGGLFVSPSLSVSMMQNLDFKISYQLFTMKPENLDRYDYNFLYWSLQYSF